MKNSIRIAEMKHLKELFKDVSKDKERIAYSLIQEAGFLKSSLEELRNRLTLDGTTENFVNGSQSMLREHPAAKTYVSFLKSYMAVMKQLTELLPENAAEGNDELTAFLDKKKLRNIG